MSEVRHSEPAPSKDEWTDVPERHEGMNRSGQKQQVVARIKRTSKYSHQAPKGGWFDVEFVADRAYPLRGNDNAYRMVDVVFGVRLEDGTIVELRL